MKKSGKCCEMIEIPILVYEVGGAGILVLSCCVVCIIGLCVIKCCLTNKEKRRVEKREKQEAADRDREQRRNRTIRQQSEFLDQVHCHHQTAMQTRQYRMHQQGLEDVNYGCKFGESPVSEYPPSYEEIATVRTVSLPTDDDLEEIIKLIS